jgi:NIPSNAP
MTVSPNAIAGAKSKSDRSGSEYAGARPDILKIVRTASHRRMVTAVSDGRNPRHRVRQYRQASMQLRIRLARRIRAISLMEVFAMIYELRVYHAMPGKLTKLVARFRDDLLPIWERHGIRPIGFWTTDIGESGNYELTYILQWASLADRETRWTAFQNDEAWHKARDESERDGPIVETISSRILVPTSFSALK